MSQCPFSQQKEGKKIAYLMPIDGLSTDEDFNNIYNWFKEKRKNSPIEYDERRKLWEFYRFEDIESILMNHKDFSIVRNHAGRTPFRSILNMDPPEHTRMKRLVMKAFTPKVVKDLEPKIQKICEEVSEEVIGKGKKEIDIVNDYAFPITISMLTDLLGVPPKDKDKFRYWSEKLLAVPKDDSEETYQKTVAQSTEMMNNIDEYLLNVIAERRANPQGDLISDLTVAEIDGELLTDQEILDFSGLLLQAGFGTTARLITNAVRCIIETPGLQDQLRADVSLIPKSLEEILRLYSSIYRTARYAKKDMKIGEQEIKAGDELSLWISSANRDEEKFDEPDVFNIEREGRNPHLALGKGIHLCLGASLARLEARLAVETLFSKTKNMKFKNTEFQPIKSLIANGLEKLDVLIEV